MKYYYIKISALMKEKIIKMQYSFEVHLTT